MLNWNDLLEEINQLFIKMTRDKIFNHDAENFIEHVKNCLKLNKKEDWNYILASENILEDSNYAIESFLKFGLDGPTKYNDLGEKYLRLYGLLNATYLQQQAICNLFKYFQCPKINDIKASIELLEIRVLRHKLGAHSADFYVTDDSTLHTFVPVRMSLENFSCKYFNHTNDESDEVDLKKAVDEHLKLMCSIYYQILIKSVNTIYKNNPDKIKSITEAADPYLAMINGASILKKIDSNTYIVINYN